MDRYECRKALLEDLKAIGQGGGEKAHVHAVRNAIAAGRRLNLLFPNNGFLRMKPLAEPAIEAVKKGDASFVPSRFDKVYLGWMENIRDWCISANFGGAIAFPFGIVMTAVPKSASVKITVCPHCGSQHLTQDEDVLDTWFSSALWPFSTLGWPDETVDLKKYFPTSVLVTGWDIIFFWVARMIFSSLAMTDQVPFKEVLIHGLVLDEHGRKDVEVVGERRRPHGNYRRSRRR